MKTSKSRKIDNLNVYSSAETVKYYDNLAGLQPCEDYVFSKYVDPGIDVLDLGVGGGRTTLYLSSENRQYTGVDYSKSMSDICRKKFPGLPFHTLDASDLSFFNSNTFDLVVFSFNGIDHLYPDEQRMKCLAEVNRLLKTRGKFIFSVHNARNAVIYPQLLSVNIPRKIWRLVRSITLSTCLLSKRLISKAFYDGIGYITDPVHGGLFIHTSIPRYVKEELIQAEFQVLEVVSSNYPFCPGEFISPWFYYVAQKV